MAIKTKLRNLKSNEAYTASQLITRSLLAGKKFIIPHVFSTHLCSNTTNVYGLSKAQVGDFVGVPYSNGILTKDTVGIVVSINHTEDASSVRLSKGTAEIQFLSSRTASSWLDLAYVFTPAQKAELEVVL
jgi:hypothetical protein